MRTGAVGQRSRQVLLEGAHVEGGSVGSSFCTTRRIGAVTVGLPVVRTWPSARRRHRARAPAGRSAAPAPLDSRHTWSRRRDRRFRSAWGSGIVATRCARPADRGHRGIVSRRSRRRWLRETATSTSRRSRATGPFRLLIARGELAPRDQGELQRLEEPGLTALIELPRRSPGFGWSLTAMPMPAAAAFE